MPKPTLPYEGQMRAVYERAGDSTSKLLAWEYPNREKDEYKALPDSQVQTLPPVPDDGTFANVELFDLGDGWFRCEWDCMADDGLYQRAIHIGHLTDVTLDDGEIPKDIQEAAQAELAKCQEMCWATIQRKRERNMLGIPDLRGNVEDGTKDSRFSFEPPKG